MVKRVADIIALPSVSCSWFWFRLIILFLGVAHGTWQLITLMLRTGPIGDVIHDSIAYDGNLSSTICLYGSLLLFMIPEILLMVSKML